MGPNGLGPELDRSSLEVGPPSVRGVREGFVPDILYQPLPLSTLLQVQEVDLHQWNP